jgi:hypothetical protein
MPDEKGTILSVNHDFWGTWITYIGYFLLYLGLMLILFDKGSRFGNLKVMLEKVKDKKKKLSVLLIFFMAAGSMFAQTPENEHEHANSAKRQVDSIIKSNAISKEHAAKFGRLVIQDAGGRMKPANTYSSELLRKISKSDSYEGLSSDQVLVSLTQNPMIWYKVPIILVEKKNDSLHHLLNVDEGEKYLTLANFFDKKGNYKLAPYLEKAYQAAVPNQFQKDFINTDKKVNLMYRALQGKILRIFPIPGHENNKWLSYPELEDGNFKGMDSVYTKQILPLYMSSLQEAEKSGDYSRANEFLESMKGFQKKFGKEVMPSEEKINAEITYTNTIFSETCSGCIWWQDLGCWFLLSRGFLKKIPLPNGR